MSKRYWLGVGVVVAVLIAAGGVLAGDLTPPGPPGATMKTLQEIYEKLEDIDAKIVGDAGDTYNAGVPKTGQTTSYRTADDGDLQKGVAWPDPRFTDNEDGTVTDNMTGLMWVKAPHSLDGNSSYQNWNDAIDFCNNLTHGGYSDWRLPNRFELESLLDLSRHSPALPSGHLFTDVRLDYYWSSSTLAGNSDIAWHVNLVAGAVTSDFKPSTYLVWPVRAGQ